jgi:Leucine-rich repeat (LRR) protein
LTSLYLDNNQLTSFSGEGLSGLTILGLVNNQLTSFSSTGLSSSLTVLELDHNQLTSFSCTGLSGLTRLQLVNNQLTSFSGEGLSSSLTILQLDNNQLTSFSCTGLSGLTRLRLQYNAALASIRVIGSAINGQYYSSGYSGAAAIAAQNCALNAAALDQMYSDLANGTGFIWVVGNPGVSGDTPSIANSKGYVVIG